MSKLQGARIVQQAIVVATTWGRERWLYNCLGTLHQSAYAVIDPILRAKGELDHIKWILAHTRLDEFLFLHDSCELLNPALLDLAFKKYQGRSVGFCESPLKFGTFLGKFRRAVLERMHNWPDVNCKVDAVHAERWFAQEYLRIEPDAPLITPTLHDRDFYTEKFGRLNMVLENQYLRKYKGHWTMEMALEADRQSADLAVQSLPSNDTIARQWYSGPYLERGGRAH